MKKILSTLLLFIAITAVAVMAIMPGTTSLGECNKFHPHADEFGGPAEVLKILGYMATNMPINVWTDGVRTVVQATRQPLSTKYFDQAAGLKKVTSEDGISSARNSINSCLKASYQSNLVPVTSSAITTASSDLLPLAAIVGIIGLLIGGAIFIMGGKKLSNAY